VIAVGVNLHIGGIGLYVVDLKTCENRQLGADLGAGVMLIGPRVSPDGKTVVAAKLGGGDEVLKSQLYLFDVASGKSKAFGQPADQAYVDFLRDGSGLMVLRRSYRDVKEKAIETICRMDWSGKVTEIRRGNCPVVLLDGKSILFRDEDEKWKMCGLDGKNERMLGDGLTKYFFATPAPDGKRVLMMQRRSEEKLAPQPTIINLADGSTQPVKIGTGLWVMPQWQ
jgi:tricorn protease-like protein